MGFVEERVVFVFVFFEVLLVSLRDGIVGELGLS
jgi:hypothetical protein